MGPAAPGGVGAIKCIELALAESGLAAADIKQVKESIQIVLEGGAALDTKVAHCILQTLREKKPARHEDLEISGRELEILQLLAEGLVKKQI